MDANPSIRMNPHKHKGEQRHAKIVARLGKVANDFLVKMLKVTELGAGLTLFRKLSYLFHYRRNGYCTIQYSSCPTTPISSSRYVRRPHEVNWITREVHIHKPFYGREGTSQRSYRTTQQTAREGRAEVSMARFTYVYNSMASGKKSFITLFPSNFVSLLFCLEGGEIN